MAFMQALLGVVLGDVRMAWTMHVTTAEINKVSILRFHHPRPTTSRLLPTLPHNQDRDDERGQEVRREPGQQDPQRYVVWVWQGWREAGVVEDGTEG